MVERISQMEGLFSLVSALADKSIVDDVREKYGVFRDEIDGHLIDTCVGFDTHKWETYIQGGIHNAIIVEQYDDKETAEKGHAKWVEQIRTSPRKPIKEVYVWDGLSDDDDDDDGEDVC